MPRKSMKPSTIVAATMAMVSPVLAQEGPTNGVEVVPGICSFEGVEYASRWSMPDNGIYYETEAICGEMCLAEAGCTGATWIVHAEPDPSKNNCWFKEWTGAPAMPCIPKGGANTYNALVAADDCAAVVFKPSEMLDCVAEEEFGPETVGDVPEPGGAVAPAAAAGPVDAAAAAPLADVEGTGDLVPDEVALAAGTPAYIVGVDFEYSPTDAAALGVDATGVMDIEGVTVVGPAECAEACTAMAGCNIAAWRGADPAWTSKSNCWLKTLSVPCEVPAEAVPTPGAYLLIQQADDCGPVALAPVALAPVAEVDPAAPVAAPVLPLAPMDPLASVPSGLNETVPGEVPGEVTPEFSPAPGATIDEFGNPLLPAAGAPESTRDLPTTTPAAGTPQPTAVEAATSSASSVQGAFMALAAGAVFVAYLAY